MKTAKPDKCIIIAGGNPPAKSLVNRLIRMGYTTVVAADGGYHNAKKVGVTPHYVIGDFDSVGKIPEHDLKLMKIIRYRRQSDTDVEKCIKFLASKGAREYVLLGGIGDRLDHSVANLGYLLKYSEVMPGTLFFGGSFVKVYENNIRLNTVKDEIISIYGFSDRVRVTSDGLKFPLRNSSLTFGIQESTSNRAAGKSVALKIKNGKIYVIRSSDSFFL